MCRKYTDKFCLCSHTTIFNTQDGGTENHVHTFNFSVFGCFLLSHANRRTGLVIVTVPDSLAVEEILVFTAGDIPASAKRYKKGSWSLNV